MGRSPSGLHAQVLGEPAAAAAFTDVARVQAMLDVEVALAEVEAELGLVPSSAVAPIRNAARAERYDLSALADDAVAAGNLAIPLVRQLTSLVAEDNPDAARHVHIGATSQDVIDTALVLQLRTAVNVVLAHLHSAADAAATLARQHVSTPMAGRTWLQQASPTTFGLKAAGWLDVVARARVRVATTLDHALVVQFGGASGTLAALGHNGPAVADALARRLKLAVPEMPWHTQRDRLADLASALGVTCGSLGKIGRDLALLAQTEVGEVFEATAPGRGGSSSMPHKRNPVSAAVAIGAAVRAPGLVATMLAAMAQEHERGVGGWQAEWETLPDLVVITAGAARAIAEALASPTVDVVRMRKNLDADGGVALAESLAAALAVHVGRPEAMARVERACERAMETRRSLRDVAADSTEIVDHISPAEIERVLTADNYLGAAHVFVDRVLERWGR